MGDSVQYMMLIEANRAMAEHMEGAGPGDSRAEPVRQPRQGRPVLVTARRWARLALAWCGRALLHGAASANARRACERA